MRIRWHVGAALVLSLFMVSAALAESFCSDFDRVVQIAPSGFRSVIDEANRGAVTAQVTEWLPGASECWYSNSQRSYWCSWRVPTSQVQRQVEDLAGAIGNCYEVHPVYNDDYGDADPIVFVDLPTASIYINGDRDSATVNLSIQAASGPARDGHRGATIEAP